MKAKRDETSCIYVFEWKAVKGNDHDKSRNPRFTVQSSFFQMSEKETLKEKLDGKSWSPRSYHSKFRIEGFLSRKL